MTPPTAAQPYQQPGGIPTRRSRPIQHPAEDSGSVRVPAVVKGAPVLGLVQEALLADAKAYFFPTTPARRAAEDQADAMARQNGSPSPAPAEQFVVVTSAAGSPAHLTPREVEILQLVADGRTNREIGRATGLSALTVKSHLARISQRLRAEDRAHIVLLALRDGAIR